MQSTSGARYSGIISGMPMPRLTTSPDEISRAARFAISRHELLDFRDDIVGGHGHQWIEISRGMAVGQIAGVVTAVGVDEGEVGANGFLHQKRFAADIDAFLPTTENGVDSYVAQYAAESRSAGAHPLRQNPLRADFSLDLAVVDHLAKLAIKTDVAHDDPHHLPACNQPADPDVVLVAVALDDREVVHAQALDLID